MEPNTALLLQHGFRMIDADMDNGHCISICYEVVSRPNAFRIEPRMKIYVAVGWSGQNMFSVKIKRRNKEVINREHLISPHYDNEPNHTF